MKNQATIRDVARRAGVAVSTASLALNGKPYVSRALRFRVLRAAEELNYLPNVSAKSLAKGQTRNIGLITPISLEHLFASSGFFARLIKGMHQASAEQGYAISLYVAESDEEVVTRIRSAAYSRSVDGFVITNPTFSTPYVKELVRNNLPFVFVGRPAEEAPYVDNDNLAVSRIGIKHLIAERHERIAFLSGPDRFTFCQDRLLGYRATLEEFGLPYEDALVWKSEESEEAAYQVVHKAAKNVDFTALFAVSGIHAVGAIRALYELGLSVPADVSVVCVNDTELTRYFIPSITAVNLHEKWLGYWAVKSLIQFVNGEEFNHRILIPGELVIRASSGHQLEE